MKTAILLLLSVLIGAGAGGYASSHMSQRNLSTGCINSLLYDLNIELDLLEHWDSKHKNDQILGEKLKHLILNKIIAVSAAKPDIRNLEGVPLEALYRLSNLSKEIDLSIKEYAVAFKMAFNYLSTIEGDLKGAVEKRKEIHKKPFK